jgi:hypothetical protein
LTICVHILIGNKIITSRPNRNIYAKKPAKTHGRINVAILPVIAAGIVLPVLLPQGFIPVVAFLKIGVMDALVPLFRLPVGPQEKEPSDRLF